jgi:hypothetical protein
MKKRILVLLSVVALMVAVMVVTVAPAFADHSTGHSQAQLRQAVIAVCLEDPSEPGILECGVGQP